MDPLFSASELSILNHRLFHIFVYDVSFYIETAEIARYGDDQTEGVFRTL